MKTGRNEPCPCGSGKKYKKCCINKKQSVSNVETNNFNKQNNFIPPKIMPYTIAKWAEPDSDTCKNNPKLTKDLADKWTPSKVRILSTETIIEKLKLGGIEFDKNEFLKECQKQNYAWKVSKIWSKQLISAPDRNFNDFVGLTSCILWERLCKDKVSYEMLDDWMQEGYKYNNTIDEDKACDIWWKVWCTYKKLFNRPNITMKEIDSDFNGSQSFFNWCQDFEITLSNASIDNKKYAEMGINFFSEFLDFLPKTDDLIIKNFTSGLGEMYCKAGHQEKGEEIMKNLIKDFPDKVVGYVGLESVLALREKNGYAPAYKEQLEILEKAKSYPVVDGENYGLDGRIEDARKEVKKLLSTTN